MQDEIKKILIDKIHPKHGCLFPVVIVDVLDEANCDRALMITKSDDGYVIQWACHEWIAGKLQEYIAAAFADEKRFVAKVSETAATISLKTVSKPKSKGKKNATAEA